MKIKSADKIKRALLRLAVAFVIGTVGISNAGECRNALAWTAWNSKFQTLLRQKHIAEPRHETFSLRTSYCNGSTPEQACEEMGCDAIAFEQVWMPAVRKLARKHGIVIPAVEREATEEGMWFEFFLEGKSPQQAAMQLVREANRRR